MLRNRSIWFKGWKAIELSNEYLRVVIVPELGGRIMGFGGPEEEFFYTMPESEGIVHTFESITDIKAFRLNMNYQAVGGYKTWLAPQTKWHWPPYLDLDLGAYEVEVRKSEEKREREGEPVGSRNVLEGTSTLDILLKSPICRETGIQLTRQIRICENSRVLEVIQSMKNHGQTPQEFGIWDVTQMQGRGFAIFPLSQDRELKNFLGNDLQPFVSVHKSETNAYAVVRFLSQTDFKVGTPHSEGWLLTVLKRGKVQWGYLKRFPVFSGAQFGHGCAVEVYDTDRFDYFEVEVHGPVQNLQPGEETFFGEEWEIFCWPADLPLSHLIAEVNQSRSVSKLNR